MSAVDERSERTRQHGAGRRLAAAGLLLVGTFAVLVVVSSTLRHYWLLLVVSAVATSVPFVLRAPVGARGLTVPVRPALPEPAPDHGTGDRPVAAALVASVVSMGKASAVRGEIDDAHGADLAGGYVAVADGASASYRAGEWARTLCDTFLDLRPLDAAPSPGWIAAATAAFRRTASDDTDHWAAEAARRGAHAAFVGLAVARHGQRLTWRATAVGDCVLVHLRGAPEGRLPIVTAFPIAHSAAFPATPTLLSSAADDPPPVSSVTASASLGDVWLLMTDELARWALRRHEAGDPLWTLLTHGSEAEIRAAITAARASRAVADDDMTVVRCMAVPADRELDVTRVGSR